MLLQASGAISHRSVMFLWSKPTGGKLLGNLQQSPPDAGSHIGPPGVMHGSHPQELHMEESFWLWHLPGAPRGRVAATASEAMWLPLRTYRRSGVLPRKVEPSGACRYSWYARGSRSCRASRTRCQRTRQLQQCWAQVESGAECCRQALRVTNSTLKVLIWRHS